MEHAKDSTPNSGMELGCVAAGGWRGRLLRMDSPLVELRLALLELVLSALWVFVTVGAAVAANTCKDSCMVMHEEPVGSMAGHMASSGMATSGMASMPCPPPTLTIQVSLATGFSAAVATGLSYTPGRSSKSRYHGIAAAVSSGGNFNPAVTLALAARGYTPPLRLLTYVMAQLAGAAIGAALWTGIVNKDCLRAAFEISNSMTTVMSGPQILLHSALALLLALVHLWAHERLMSMATPILIGFSYVAATLVGFQMLGNEVPNPLRTFGLAVVGGVSWDRFPAVVGGGFCGGLAAACLDLLLFERRLWEASGLVLPGRQRMHSEDDDETATNSSEEQASEAMDHSNHLA